MDNKTKYRIVAAIRRCFSRSENAIAVRKRRRRTRPRYNADGTRHKVDSVFFSCELCGEEVKSNQCEVDHIEEVMKDGWVDWDTFIARLFCDISNLQLICKKCHKKKTAEFKKKGAKEKPPKPRKKLTS